MIVFELPSDYAHGISTDEPSKIAIITILYEPQMQREHCHLPEAASCLELLELA
jgi:hypothetical protein